MACSYEDPRLELIVDDGYKYIESLEDDSFDVIITDSSDPQGPAECLFKEPYYRLLKRKLSQKGIICCQAESIWFDLEFIRKLMDMNRKIFEHVAYASIITSSYPGGQIGFLIGSKDPEANLRKPLHLLNEDELELKYYSKAVHESAFVLPRLAYKRLYHQNS